VALITGAARRLGRHLSLSLAASGHGVIVNYLTSAEEADELVAEIVDGGGYARAVRADVSDRRAVEAMVASIGETEGRLDLLINNVGIYERVSLREIEPYAWERTLQTNLTGSFYCYHFARPLLEASGGHIINIGYAGIDRVDGSVTATAYLASKTGLLVLTKSLAMALGPYGVRVNMVSPGQLENSVDLPEDVERVVPLQRPGQLADVAQAVAYLLDTDYVTGVNLDVAGGFRL
jgi:NAD(P)-dependent dehydrogenase (short-subunit alcohol dehydrogenase family)